MLTTTRFPTAFALFIVLGLSSALGGCAPALIGAGATVGVAAFEERGVEGVARDSALSARILANYVDTDANLATEVGIEVWEGRAMLTGLVKDEKERAEAVKQAWRVDGVKDVINEIGIRSGQGVKDYAKDSWITAQLRSRITFDNKVYAINYAIETVNHVVYLIGIAQNQAELDRIIAHARDIDGVTRVISHVRVKDAKAS